MSTDPLVPPRVLERRERAANVARFYALSVEGTLFGGAALVREWGRLGTSGRRRLDLFADPAEARAALEAWLSRKRRRGYRLVRGRDRHEAGRSSETGDDGPSDVRVPPRHREVIP